MRATLRTLRHVGRPWAVLDRSLRLRMPLRILCILGVSACPYQALPPVGVTPGPDAADTPDAADPPDAANTPDAATVPALPCSQFACDNLNPTKAVDSSTGASCAGSPMTVQGGSMDADNGTLELRRGE